MSLEEQLPLAEVKNRLSEVVDLVERERGRIVITKRGRPAAVVLSVEELASLEETLDVMGSRQLVDEIREALQEARAGHVRPVTKEDALALISER